MSTSHHNGSVSLRGRILRAAIVGVAAGALCTPALAAPGTRSGVVSSKLTVTFAKAPPGGSSVSCSVSLIGSDTNSPTDSKSTSAAVSGSTATCTLAVHYRWTLADTGSNMTIVYSVSGPSQSSSGIIKTIVMPADGATTMANASISQ